MVPIFVIVLNGGKIFQLLGQNHDVIVAAERWVVMDKANGWEWVVMEKGGVGGDGKGWEWVVMEKGGSGW